MIGAGGDQGAGKTGRTLVVLQPSYLPWLGYFDQIRRSDIFVFYDTAAYDKNGWRNRNRIKSQSGQPLWLTVPVQAHLGSRIMDVQIDSRSAWARKHVQSIAQNYPRTPYIEACLPELEELLARPWRSISDLAIETVFLLCRWLGVEGEFLRASELTLKGDRSERLLNLCRDLGATHYLSGDSARAYLDVGLFHSNQVEVIWQNFAHPVYTQKNGPFISHLSALDLVLNCGPESADILKDKADSRQ
jgi:hypothetical protein